GDEIATAESDTIATLLAKHLKDEKDERVRARLIEGLGFAGTSKAARELVAIRDEGAEAERLLAARALRLAATESEPADLVRGLAKGPAIADESALTLGILERRLRAAHVATIDTETRTALLGRFKKRNSYAFVFAISAMADPREDAREALAEALDDAQGD